MPTLGETVRVLAEERVLGEHAGTLVSRFGQADAALLAKGEQLYTGARAAFNGLIAQLQLELIDTRKPSESKQFSDALAIAMDRRKALLALVAGRLSGQEGAKSGAEAVIANALAKSVGEVISGLSDAAVKLWKEFSEARQARRDEIRARLEAEKWRPFVELTSGA